MIINEFNILALFHTYNQDYFNGVLPIPKIKISSSYRTLGYFHCESDGFDGYYDETIEISGNYDYTESQLRDILVHEMIHYYLLFNGTDKKCSHGRKFKNMMNEFNLRYGMNISVRVDLTPFKVRKGKSKLMFNICTFF